MTRYDVVESTVGRLVLSGDDDCDGALTGVHFAVHRGVDPVGPAWVRSPGAFADATEQLAEWFAGERRAFDLDVRPAAGSPFQQRVWAALHAIPYGATRTYAELADALGSSARAVGGANARNPLSIVVPCHRVVGAAGLTGYAGGLDAKRRLLDLEARVAEGVGPSPLHP